jgi:hypothetical protein
MPTTQWESSDRWPQDIDCGEIANFVPHPNRPWARPSGIVLEEESHTDIAFNQWTEKINQAPAVQLEGREDNGSSNMLNQGEIRHSASWSHETTADEPWVGVPTDFLAQNSFHDGMVDDVEVEVIPEGVGGQQPAKSSAIPTQSNRSASDACGPRQDQDTVDQTPSRRSPSARSDSLNSTENEPLFGLDWEKLDSGTESQVISSAATAQSDWTLLEKPHENFEKTFLLENSNSKSITWVSGDSNSKELSPQRPQRRGPFMDQQQREETSNTRKLKACVRCRMQKIRCQINANDPTGICQTCQAVSKQKIHTLPCVRYRLTESTLYRIGKAPGLEFTFRWPVMKLRDISEWADTEIRTIKVISDVCPIPLELSVRKFVPIPQDSLHKSWMDGKVQKFKETTPYAIVNMAATVKYMRDYIDEHIFQCMEHWLVGRDPWIQETYKFARQYMLIAPPEEQNLLSDVFRFWFAIRRTALTEYIVGDDTLDMEPENTDRSFPLFGKVPLPPVMIQQLDMILTLGFLQPLKKKHLEDLSRIVLANRPKSWMTIYLKTFISLHSCATLTAENYQNARKHGLKRRFAMPNFISERHHSANVYLSHYHYCTKPCNPFNIDWRKRQTTPFAEMTTDEIHFLKKTSEMVKERQDKIRITHELNLYEDDLYFVSQMFEENWTPRDTIIDYTDETILGEPLKWVA